MKLTNDFDLPEPIVQAVLNDGYTRGDADISVTQLLDPPRKIALTKQHEDELTEDVSDRIFSLLGTAVHNVLEKAEVPGLQEERLYAEYGGWTVSGQFDYMDEDGILWDWKTASTYELQNGVKGGRTEQLNCYAALARLNGLTVSGLRVGFILRDWSKTKSKRETNYPPHQVVVYPITLWSPAQQDAFIEERVRLHQAALINLPECSDEDRWARPNKYAVMKPGGNRAVKLFDTNEEAIFFCKGDQYVEERTGASIRCESYCPALNWCDQGRLVTQ